MTDEEFLALPYRPNAGLVLLNHEGKVFAGKRIDTGGKPWQMPQGGIDKGEAEEAAAYRELEEETGVSAGLVDVLAVSKSWIKYDFPRDVAKNLWRTRSGRTKYRGQKQRWYLMRFLGEDSQVNIETAEPEFCEWRWMEPASVVENIVPFKRGIYQEVFEEFKAWL